MLRWSWKGYVLMHEVVGLHLSRHSNFKMPSITLMMNGMSDGDFAQGIDIICLDQSECRQWSLGLRTLIRTQPNNSRALSSELVSLVMSAFRSADAQAMSVLSVPQLLDCFARLNVLKSVEWAQESMERHKHEGDKGLNFHQARHKPDLV